MPKVFDKRAGKLFLIIIATLILLCVLFAVPSFAGKISKEKINAYLELAKNVPSESAFVVMATDLESSLHSLNEILKKYQSSDPTFKHHQFLTLVKGSIGYNIFDKADLAEMGVDFKRGVVSFSAFGQDRPIISFSASDNTKAKAMLKNMATNMAQAVACEVIKEKGYEIQYFNKDGNLAGKQLFVYTSFGNTYFLTAMPEDKAAFEKLIKQLVTLNPKKTLAKDAKFKKMLSRLQSDTQVIYYNDYKNYLADLKRGLENTKKQISGKLSKDQMSFMPLLDEIVVFADAFKAQIFGLNLTTDKVSFVHELVGHKKKFSKIKKFFKLTGKKQFGSLKLQSDPIGSIYAQINFRAVLDYLKKDKPETRKKFNKWNAEFKTNFGVDLEHEIVNALTGEMAVLFYGLSPLTDEYLNARGMTNDQMFGLAKMLFVSGLKNPSKTIKALKAGAETIKNDASFNNSSLKAENVPGFDLYYSTEKNGVFVQYGIYGKLFLVATGKDSLKNLVSASGKLNVTDSKKSFSNMSFDFKRLVQTMENLHPPMDAKNTQLFQQWLLWEKQFEPKISFLKKCVSTSVHTSDGFRSSGEITF